MATITTLNESDNGSVSRGVINTNFDNLNNDKLEKSNAESFGFDTTAGVIVGEGEIAWNDEDGTLDVGMKGGNVTGQLFEELFIYAKASEAITNGDVVYKSGVVGGSSKLEVSKYIADGTIDPILVLGIATEDIAIGDFGFVTTFGKIRGLDTSAYTEDTILYASPTTAGAYTNTKPTAPNIIVPIALVTYSHANNGVLSTEKRYLPKIEDLNGIQITSPTTGQSMIYDGTKWVNGTISASNVSNTPAGNISATTVQGAINELDSEKEPTFTKNTAFNKNFGTTSGTVAEGDHLHTGVYEPVFSKNTAFNKNFGTTSGTVLEGSKDAEYVKLSGAQTITGEKTFNNGIIVDKSVQILNDSFIDPSTATLDRTHLNLSIDASSGYRRFLDIFTRAVASGGVGGSAIRFWVNTNTSTTPFEAMRIDRNGNVGIGTVNPASPGHIYQNNTEVGGGAGLTIEQDGTGDAVVQFLLTGVRRWVIGIDNSDSDKFKFSPTADVGNGNVWINVSGHIGMDSMPTTASGGRFYVDGSGFVKWAA